jgi:hypothetical protein
MSRRAAALALSLCALLLRPAVAAAADVARFAIVIGNNHGEADNVAELRFADDDAVATHELLLEAGVDSVLLTRLDQDSRRLYPQFDGVQPPRRRDLDDAFAAVSARMRVAASGGAVTELLLFYSGHGDVAGGEGYVVLEDGRLTRTMLHTLLAHSPAVRNHVFVDACKSYFLAFDKGAGGRRETYGSSFVADTVPAGLANTGFVLSTSSDRDSHEWERYQAGILSHELRSALRGAADVDRDGRITYAELGAFLATANESIPNPKYRPDFMVRPPGRDLRREVLNWNASAAAVRIQGAPVGHFYVETADGERLLDGHPELGQEVALHVPAARPLFVRRNDETAEYVVLGPGPVRVASLDAAPSSVERKGALHLAFEQLFALSFGRRNVAEFERRIDLAEVSPPARESPTSHTRATIRAIAGPVAIAAAAAGVALNIVSAQRYYAGQGASQVRIAELNRTVRALNTASIACYAVAGAAALTWGWAKLWPGTVVWIEPVSSADEARRHSFTVGIGRQF